MLKIAQIAQIQRESPCSYEALAPLPLSSRSPEDLEMPINPLGERIAFQVGTNSPDAWFKLELFIPSLLPDPWAPVRGGN